jgi:predicted ATPase/DNA-binding SARP family transcriptional activator
VNLRFRALGPLEVVVDGSVVPVGGPRAGSILSVLLLEAGGIVGRDRLIDEVWADDPPATAVSTLQVHVSGLRKLVGAALRTYGTGYALDVTPEQIDAARFEALLGEACRAEDPAGRARLTRAALALWRGDPFAGVPPVPTVAAAQARLSELRLQAIEERVDADLALGRHVELAAELTELSLANPCRERLAGQLMLALHRAGRSADAISALVRIRRALQEQLGVGPGSGLLALEQAIRRDDPTLAAPPPVYLPSPPGRFIGRKVELAETGDLFVRTRLLTLVGPGGSGKTRLALELARRTLPDHPDGARFVDLAPLEPSASVAAAVVAELELRERPGESPAETLASQLHSRRFLLLLDNCERVAEACGWLVMRLLERCPGLRVLATSRQPLGLPGEVVWRVPGLATADAASPDDASSADAVRLLADRAAAPATELDPALAASICQRVDGLPLAIELVAARLASASIDEIAANLDRALSLLTNPGPGRPPRHRTMRAAIDWSHALLDAEERAVFRRLSVLAGTFELAAAEEVAADPEGEAPASAADVMAVLFRLVDKSMVAPVSSFAGRTRYRLLDTVREYAAEQLSDPVDPPHEIRTQPPRFRGDPGEADRARRRHVAWCVRLVGSAMGPRSMFVEYWPARIDPEMANLRAGVEWCLQAGQVDEAIAIVAPLWPYFWLQGTAGEGRDWLLRCLAAIDDTPRPARGIALRAAAHLALHDGDYAEARRLGEECLANYRALDDPRGLWGALNGLGVTAHAVGDFEGALAHLRQALELTERTRSRTRRAMTLGSVGAALRGLDRFDEAAEALRSALESARDLGDPRTEADVLHNMGLLAAQVGDLDLARRRTRESVAAFGRFRYADGQLDAIETLAWIEAAGGRPFEALRLLAVVDRERHLHAGAAPNIDRRRRREATLETAQAALSAEEQAAALAAARLIGRDDLVEELT